MKQFLIKLRVAIVATGAIGVTSLGLIALPANAEQGNEPSARAGFLGSNPSGKLGRDGEPLFSKALDQTMHTFNKKQPAADNSFKAECPPTVHCVVIPAAYMANNGNVEDYGNYDITNRPKDMAINSVVIHDTEGDLQSVLSAFQDPTFYASVHYVVDTDGTIYQMVQDKNIAWHAGNWSVNMHSIGIEHIGHAATGSTDYTPAMYHASAQLVKYLTDKYDILRDREHIIGHDNVPATTTDGIASMHTDPGPYWNWQNYMAMIGAPVLPTSNLRHKSNMVTIAPVWPLNKLTVTGCTTNTQSCVPSGAHADSFIYLRAEPNEDAAFFTDPVIGQGSTDINNNAARLFYGQTFAVADQKIDNHGIWYEVWVNGRTGWFYSPWKAPTAFPASGEYVTPKSDSGAAVYGRAIPERSEYPTDLLATPPASWYIPTPTPLVYTVAAGQRYKLIEEVPTDHFYAWASDSSFPYDHTVFHGATNYLEIQIGNRVGYVKADSVNIR